MFAANIAGQSTNSEHSDTGLEPVHPDHQLVLAECEEGKLLAIITIYMMAA